MSLDGLIGGAAVLIEFGGGGVIAVACLRGLLAMTVGRGMHPANVKGRSIVAEGVIAALHGCEFKRARRSVVEAIDRVCRR